MQYAAYGGLLLLLLLLFLQAFWKVAPKSHSQKYQATESAGAEHLHSMYRTLDSTLSLETNNNKGSSGQAHS